MGFIPQLVFASCVQLRARGRHYDYIEIGTADFDTLAQALHYTNAEGISVEPVGEHLERLPDSPLRKKVQAAVTGEDGWADLFVVKQKYMEPHCSNDTLPGLGVPYCLPWWFRATASMYEPSSLVFTHYGDLAHQAQTAVSVRTITYRTLLSQHKVSSVQMLKVDTEGLDMAIMQQVIDVGMETGLWPERVQFERNNLTDSRSEGHVYPFLQAYYDCWLPNSEEDVQCVRLRNAAAKRPATSSLICARNDGPTAYLDALYCSPTHSEAPAQQSWWQVELADRLFVASVAVQMPADAAQDDAPHWTVHVGDHRDVWRNAACGERQLPLAPGEQRALNCRLDGRYVGLVGPSSALAGYSVQASAVVSRRGSWRIFSQRQCCHGSCEDPEVLFEGYEPDCEGRCRAHASCRFFTVYASLWCSMAASCDEDMPGQATAVTYALQGFPFVPLPLAHARQSSDGWGGAADRAVDGQMDPHFMMRSCSHTADDAQDDGGPWWVATLGSRSAVAAVRVLGRWDCCNERLAGWEVRVGDDPDPRRNARCGGTMQPPLQPGGRRLVQCQWGTVGLYVGIVMPHSSEPLTLCEVEAFTHRGMVVDA